MMKKKSILPRRPAPARHSHLSDGGRLCGENSVSGFSLIEVLVSMTVLIVIIVLVTNMFRNASEAWDTGTQRAEMNTAARCAVEYIARELSCAVAGSIPTSTGGVAIVKNFKLEKDVDDNVQDLSFVALSGETNALRGIRFRFNRTDRTIETARETVETGLFYPYNNSAYGGDYNLLITNVWRFVALVYTNESDMTSGYAAPSPYDFPELPAGVDISLEMLGERDMARALSLTAGAQQDGYVMTNSRVYTTRVCFPNRGEDRGQKSD